MSATQRFSIFATYPQAAGLAELVARLCARRPGSDPRAVDALRLCLAEALNNIVAHAYGGAGGPITAELRLSGGRAEVRLIDRGRPITGLPAGAPGVDPGDVATLPEGGFGWMLIRTQADAVDYRRVRGRNLLRLVKRLGPGA